MNEKINIGESAYDKGFRQPEEVMNLLIDKMIESRPRKDVEWKAYFKQSMYEQRSVSGAVVLDMDAGFSQSAEGDVAYAASWLWSDREEDCSLTIRGNGKVWLNGECVYDSCDWNDALDVPGREGYTIIPIHLKENYNELLIRCVKGQKSFGVSMYVNNSRYPYRWGRDYLISIRCTMPCAEMEGLEGVAFLGAIPGESAPTGRIEIDYEKGLECAGKQYNWYPVKDEQATAETADFVKIYGIHSAACAYALTYCEMENGQEYILELECEGMLKVFVDGEQVYVSQCPGKHNLPLSGNGSREILVKCVGGLERSRKLDSE